MGDDKWKQSKESAWVRKALTKEPEFDLEHVKETFMEAKTRVAMVPYSVMDGKPTEDFSHGKIARGDS